MDKGSVKDHSHIQRIFWEKLIKKENAFIFGFLCVLAGENDTFIFLLRMLEGLSFKPFHCSGCSYCRKHNVLCLKLTCSDLVHQAHIHAPIKDKKQEESAFFLCDVYRGTGQGH